MITINLLPIVSFKAKYKGRVFIIGHALAMVIAAAALFSVKVNVMDKSLDTNKADIKAKTTVLNDTKGEVTKAAKITADTFKKWQQLNAIIELEERRRDQTRLLVEVEELLPKTNAWLVSLKHDKGKLVLEGISTDKETVSQFLTRLEGAAYIERKSVTLVEITQNLVINGIKLTKFKINADTSFPEPVIINDGLPEFGLLSQAEFIKAVEAAAPELVANIKNNAAKSGKAL